VASEHPDKRRARLLIWLALDVVGLLLFALGALHFIGKLQIIDLFAANSVMAAVTAVIGGVMMLAAAVAILRTVTRSGDAPESR
jgi:hypothetical protein